MKSIKHFFGKLFCKLYGHRRYDFNPKILKCVRCGEFKAKEEPEAQKRQLIGYGIYRCGYHWRTLGGHGEYTQCRYVVNHSGVHSDLNSSFIAQDLENTVPHYWTRADY